MNTFNALQYKQNIQEYFITVLPFQLIDEISTTLVYGDDPYGYQRGLNPLHYNRLVKSIRKENDLILPTSIILGINRTDFDKVKKEKLEGNAWKITINSNKEEKIYRIIDGQHRLKGLKLATEKESEGEYKNKLLNYNLSVILMIIEDDNRVREVNAFNDINSKAKPLKMDLTILARYKYELLEGINNFNEERYIEHVAIKVAYILNEDEKSVWKNAIKLDVNNSNSLGIIGFKTFFDSIKPICKQLIKQDYFPQKIDGFKETLDSINSHAEIIAKELLIPCWNIVYKKWSECFDNNVYFYNFDEVNTIYNKKYYIQKTMGLKSINSIINKTLSERDGNITEVIESFKTKIEASELVGESWKMGGLFSGLSSESGFKKIEEEILVGIKKIEEEMKKNRNFT